MRARSMGSRTKRRRYHHAQVRSGLNGGWVTHKVCDTPVQAQNYLAEHVHPFYKHATRVFSTHKKRLR